MKLKFSILRNPLEPRFIKLCILEDTRELASIEEVDLLFLSTNHPSVHRALIERFRRMRDAHFKSFGYIH